MIFPQSNSIHRFSSCLSKYGLCFRANIHARPCIESQEGSPATFDHHFHHHDDINQFRPHTDSHLTSLTSRLPGHEDDDDDDMDLGDEAGAGLLGNMSDEDGNMSPSLNVSPTNEDEEDGAPELVDQKALQTPPLTPTTTARITMANNIIDQSIAYSINEHDHDDHQNHLPTISNTFSSYKQNSVSLCLSHWSMNGIISILDNCQFIHDQDSE